MRHRNLLLQIYSVSWSYFDIQVILQTYARTGINRIDMMLLLALPTRAK